MTSERYPLELGRLVANLHSLEFLLRAFLLRSRDGYQPAFDISKLKPGGYAPLNHFTNGDGLRVLIQKYNRDIQGTRAEQLQVDEQIANLRNALFHGRVSSDNPSLQGMRLLNFEPMGNQVHVIFDVTLDVANLQKQINGVSAELRKIHQAASVLFPDLTQ